MSPRNWPRFAFRLLLALTPLAAIGCGKAAVADPAAATAERQAVAQSDLDQAWVRVVRDDEKRPLAMETAIVRYVPADDYSPDKAPGDYERYVDLVGAVHIADHAYYAALNRRFREYDTVLYELVAPEGTVVPLGRGTSSSHPLGRPAERHEDDARSRAPARADRLHAAELRPRRLVARRVHEVDGSPGRKVP